MRVAFLCKRRYMGKDVILDRYARLYEYPRQLAQRGHTVLALCLAYRGEPDGRWRHGAPPGELAWESRSLGRLVVPGLLSYPARLLARLEQFRPDLVIGASDIPHAALAAWVAGRLGVPYAVDLYDNFEGFGQARIPGMKGLLRRSVRRAGLVTTTSEPLADLVRDGYRAAGRVVPMPSTIDRTLFRRRDRVESRRRLQLPVAARLVGTAGALNRDRGIGALYEAWARIAQTVPDAHLVLAGPHETGLPPPRDERIHYLGVLPHDQAAELLAALDVGVIYMRETPFGSYCFPQKAYEMLACGVPVVAASVGAMKALFRETPSLLYRPDDPKDLARAVLAQLSVPVIPEVPIRDWAELIAMIEPELLALTCRSGSA